MYVCIYVHVYGGKLCGEVWVLEPECSLAPPPANSGTSGEEDLACPRLLICKMGMVTTPTSGGYWGRDLREGCQV